MNTQMSGREVAGQAQPGDSELLLRCAGGDAAAWRLLVGRYGEFVYSVCRATGLSDADASDVTQQTFCILKDSLAGLGEESRLGGWLATVARRHSWRVLARVRREVAVAPEEIREQLEGQDVEGSSSAGWEQLEWLHHGLSLMDERCRGLLTELYLRPEALPYESVAVRLGIPLGSIGPTRARCLQKLRTLLESP